MRSCSKTITTVRHTLRRATRDIVVRLLNATEELPLPASCVFTVIACSNWNQAESILHGSYRSLALTQLHKLTVSPLNNLDGILDIQLLQNI